MAQGGDFTKFNGTGGESIYGKKFADENFKIKHSEKYLLSMANAGRNTNGSQFFITFEATPHLDQKHCVFGRVERGQNIIEAMQRVPTSPEDKPRATIKISKCGQMRLKKEFAEKKPESAAAATSESKSSEKPADSILSRSKDIKKDKKKHKKDKKQKRESVL